jgi:RNA polymerase sigma-70 factor (ECF subfamily)
VGPMATTTDEELMARFQGGDLESFGVLAGRYEAPLFRLANRYLGRPEEAEEVRQDALMKAYAQAASFDPGGRFRSWIFRIAVNLCHDRSRRRRRWRWVPFADPEEQNTAGPTQEPSAPEAESSMERRETSHRVRQALNALPKEQRAVLVMKEFEEMKFREIADVLGCPESTVKSRLYRGLSALRASMDDPR